MIKIICAYSDLVLKEKVTSLLSSVYQLEFISINSFRSLTELSELVPKIILLDYSEPKNSENILELITQSEQLSHTPVMVLSSQFKLEEKANCYKLGAFDYLVYPEELEDLSSRIKINLKRTEYIRQKDLEKTPVLIKIGPFKIDFEKGQIEVKEKGDYKTLDLTHLEFKLLSYFIKNEGRPISRKELIDYLGNGNVVVSDRAVDVHISAIRKKGPIVKEYLKTIYGMGYKFKKVS